MVQREFISWFGTPSGMGETHEDGILARDETVTNGDICEDEVAAVAKELAKAMASVAGH